MIFFYSAVLEKNRRAHKKFRDSLTEEEQMKAREKNRLAQQRRRLSQTLEEKLARQEKNRVAQKRRREMTRELAAATAASDSDDVNQNLDSLSVKTVSTNGTSNSITPVVTEFVGASSTVNTFNDLNMNSFNTFPGSGHDKSLGIINIVADYNHSNSLNFKNSEINIIDTNFCSNVKNSDIQSVQQLLLGNDSNIVNHNSHDTALYNVDNGYNHQISIDGTDNSISLNQYQLQSIHLNIHQNQYHGQQQQRLDSNNSVSIQNRESTQRLDRLLDNNLTYNYMV